MLCSVISVKFIMSTIIAEYIQESSEMPFVGEWPFVIKVNISFWALYCLHVCRQAHTSHFKCCILQNPYVRASLMWIRFYCQNWK
jgi:hypothetical protein